MSDRKQYLAKNTALFALNTIGTRIINFLLVPLYTRTFTTAEYGIIDLVVTIATILVPIITINIGEAVMRFSLDEDANRSNIVSVGIFYSGLSLILGLSVFIVLRWFPSITINGWLVYFYCMTQGLYGVFACNLRGQEKLVEFALANVIHTFLAAGLNIIFLVQFKLGIGGYFMAYIIADLMSLVYCLVAGRVKDSLREFHIDFALMKSMVTYSIVLVPNSLMWWIMNSSDHMMVTNMIGNAANGIYAISYKIPSIVSALTTVFNQAWSYSAIHENQSSDREEFNNAVFDKLVRFQMVLTAGLLLIIKPFLRIYVKPDFFEAWMYTPYLFIGNFFLTIGTFLSSMYTVNKDSKGFLYSGTLGAIINITLNWILIPKIGIHGAALATCISYICVMLYRVIDTRKYMTIKVFRWEYIVGYISLILMGLTMAISGRKGLVALIAELLFILVWNRGFIKECMTQISAIIKKRLNR